MFGSSEDVGDTESSSGGTDLVGAGWIILIAQERMKDSLLSGVLKQHAFEDYELLLRLVLQLPVASAL